MRTRRNSEALANAIALQNARDYTRHKYGHGSGYVDSSSRGIYTEVPEDVTLHDWDIKQPPAALSGGQRPGDGAHELHGTLTAAELGGWDTYERKTKWAQGGRIHDTYYHP